MDRYHLRVHVGLQLRAKVIEDEKTWGEKLIFMTFIRVMLGYEHYIGMGISVGVGMVS